MLSPEAAIQVLETFPLNLKTIAYGRLAARAQGDVRLTACALKPRLPEYDAMYTEKSEYTKCVAGEVDKHSAKSHHIALK